MSYRAIEPGVQEVLGQICLAKRLLTEIVLLIRRAEELHGFAEVPVLWKPPGVLPVIPVIRPLRTKMLWNGGSPWLNTTLWAVR